MGFEVQVTEVARRLNLLDEAAKLIELDSLSVLDFVIELEDATGIELPPEALQPEAFSSIESVAALLAKHERKGG